MVKDKSLKLLESDCVDAMQLILNIIHSNENFKNKVSLGIHPYLSMVVEGIDNLVGLSMSEYQEVGNFSFERLYNKSRARTKIYSDKRFKRNIKVIESVERKAFKELTKDYNLFQKSVIKIRGQKTLGVFFIEEIPIYNNFIGYIDLLEVLGIDDSDKIIEESKSNSIVTFSSYLANYIQKAVHSFDIDIKSFHNIKDSKPFISKDDFYLTPFHKNKVFNKKYDLGTSMFLYNIFCSINYTLYILPHILNEKSNLYLRIKLICYYSSVESLDKLVKGYNYNSGASNYQTELTEIISTKRNLDKKDGLRNNLFHYELIIPKELLLKKIFEPKDIFNEVLRYYTSLSRTEINRTINAEFQKIEKLITKWIL